MRAQMDLHAFKGQYLCHLNYDICIEYDKYIHEQSEDINQIKMHGELMVMEMKKLIFPEIILDMDILLNIPYKLLTCS